MTKARAEFDAAQIARAVGFTVSRFQGRGRYDTRRFATQAEAEADAQGDARAMVYAITPEGFTIHISNGDAIAPQTETAMTDQATTAPTRDEKRIAKIKAADAKRAAQAAAPKAEKAPKAPKAPKAAKTGARAATQAAVQRGELPSPPDFSAETHKRFRPKLDEVKALVEAGDIAGLRAYPINPTSTSPKALDRYRNLAVLALEAKAAA
jgi:hypothetical protein